MMYRIIIYLIIAILFILPILEEYWKIILPVVSILFIIKYIIQLYWWGKDNNTWD